jgi:hypothetical protein
MNGQVYGPTRGAVLAVYNDNGTHKLSMKGHVEAESGKIGDWEIGEVNPDKSGKVGFFKKDTSINKGYCTGMVPYGDGGNVNIWAGASYNNQAMTPWEIYNALDASSLDTNTWSNYVPFYVTGNGEVHCSNI